MENNVALTREEIEKRRKDIEIEDQNLIGMLNDLDRDRRVGYLNQFVGKCYKQKHFEPGAFINSCSCLMVYKVDEKRLKAWSISVTYWDNDPEFIPEYFGIESSDLFDPENEDMKKWIEITKEEFNTHYNEVEKRINLARGIHTFTI